MTPSFEATFVTCVAPSAPNAAAEAPERGSNGHRQGLTNRGSHRCHHPGMDAQTIDQEYAKLEGEFEDVAKTVQGLVEKMQAAEKAGDTNAAEWLGDMKLIVQDISDEQTQAKVLLLAMHGFVKNLADAQAAADPEQKPPLFAPGQEPEEQPQQQPVYQRPHGLFGGMMGGPMMGGYMGGGFAQAMEMGAGIGLGQSLISSIFR
jgi:hypothetical protein